MRDGRPGPVLIRPRVDVLVVTWNTGELTADCLRRLLDNDQGADLRVLVHDNCSTDGTPALLAARVPEASVVVGSVNAGFAAGVNALVARSTAQWLLVLNSDAWPDPGVVGGLVAACGPGIGLVAPRLESPDGVHEPSVHPFPSVRSAFRAALLREPPAVAGPVDWAVGACWLVRREAFRPLDETLFMYGEDLAFCRDLSARGWSVLYAPSLVVRHVGNASGSLAYESADRTRAWVRNDLVLYPRRTRPAYRLVRGLGALRAARLASSPDGAEHWRTVARAYLRRS